LFRAHEALEEDSIRRQPDTINGTWRVALRRRISLAVIFAFSAIMAFLYNGCAKAPVEEKPAFPLSQIKDHLGEDDGYAFAIFYGADIHGSLETCG
jgi:hypothetical protein